MVHFQPLSLSAQTAYARRVLKGTPHEGIPLLSAAAPFKAGGRGGPTYYTDVPAGDVVVRIAVRPR